MNKKQIQKMYELAGLKTNRISKTRLGDGYFVYHKYGAETYSKTYPGRRRDFIDKSSKDSLKIHIMEARMMAGLPKLKNINKIIDSIIKK